MPTEIVPLVPENIASFARLYQSVFNGPPWHDGWSEEGVLERLTSFAQYPKFCGLGCLIDENPVALALGWGERWVGGWHFHIKELYVASEVQRQKVGTKLLSAFELELSRQGYKRVFLETGESAQRACSTRSMATPESSSQPWQSPSRPNPSIEGTCNIWLCQLSPAPHVKR